VSRNAWFINKPANTPIANIDRKSTVRKLMLDETLMKFPPMITSKTAKAMTILLRLFILFRRPDNEINKSDYSQRISVFLDKLHLACPSRENRRRPLFPSPVSMGFFLTHHSTYR